MVFFYWELPWFLGSFNSKVVKLRPSPAVSSRALNLGGFSVMRREFSLKLQVFRLNFSDINLIF